MIEFLKDSYGVILAVAAPVGTTILYFGLKAIKNVFTNNNEAMMDHYVKQFDELKKSFSKYVTDELKIEEAFDNFLLQIKENEKLKLEVEIFKLREIADSEIELDKKRNIETIIRALELKINEQII